MSNKLPNPPRQKFALLDKCVSVRNIFRKSAKNKPTISIQEVRSDSAEKSSENNNSFLVALKQIENHDLYRAKVTDKSPYGYFRRRHIIGECTSIMDGIYINPDAEECLVVDEKYGSLNNVFNKTLSRIALLDRESARYEHDVFIKVIHLSREILRFSEESVSKIHREYNVKKYDKITLDLFIQRRSGVERHQVLLAAYLIEKLKSENLISAYASIEARYFEDGSREKLLLHTNDGEIYRFDPIRGLGKCALH